MQRPEPNEYAGYFEKYVKLVDEGDVIDVLQKQSDDFIGRLRGLDEAKWAHRYAPEKWSVKQVVGHLIDAERVFAYRALVFGRGDKAELPSFDEQGYMATAGYDAVSGSALAEEWEALRKGTVLFFRGLPAEAWERMGVASSNKVSVRALAFITAGHVRHHAGVLRERYGV